MSATQKKKSNGENIQPLLFLCLMMRKVCQLHMFVNDA
jgi:hypothetical protein